MHVGYLGVVGFDEALPARSETPRLLYLGRLKKYKRIELLLDAVEAIPGAVLDIAGEGDHRPELEAEIARRGLGDRVVLHGHVTEAVKAQLYAQAWVNLTASSAEGWCLTVMEAATCGTPSVALRVGGLAESIVDGETGLLADDEAGLVAAVRRVVEEPGLRERLGAAARERAASFTWERTARETLDVLEGARSRKAVKLRTVLSQSETLKAVGMAAATMANNALAVIFTVLFARLLGADDYGSLAALVSTFVILAVPGSALQVAVAREVALGRMSVAETLAVWRRRLLIGGFVVTAVAVLLREPISDLIAVDQAWAAAATAPTAALWILLCVERGALQGVHAYKPVAWSLVLEVRRAAGVRGDPGGGRPGCERRVPRDAAVVPGHRARVVVGRAQPDRDRFRIARSAAPVGSRRRRVARGDRPVPDRGAAERGRDHGQAADRRRRGRRLRGRRRGGQGRRVGGDRDRAVPVAGGHARRPPRRGPAAGADAGAGRRGGGRRADAVRLCGRARDRAAARVRARTPWSPRTRCSCSAAR